MNNISFPIQTIREGNKITKICVEDISKTKNRIKLAINNAFSKMSAELQKVNKTYNGVHSSFVIGKGVSQPCILDTFDEEIGNNIAFMKAKLNANIKKYKLLKRLLRYYVSLGVALWDEFDKLEEYINLDLDGIRKHNPDYLKDSEDWW